MRMLRIVGHVYHTDTHLHIQYMKKYICDFYTDLSVYLRSDTAKMSIKKLSQKERRVSIDTLYTIFLPLQGTKTTT
jgi:hypothetical protein